MNRKKPYIELGKITTTHGINGFLKIDGWCDDLKIFNNLKKIYLDSYGKENLDIDRIKLNKTYALIKFRDIDTINEAQKYKDGIIYIKREDLKLKKGEILIQDLIGVEIYDYLKQDIFYGKIKEVIKTGANDVYVISKGNEKEKLIPVIEDVIKNKDLENGKIYINVIKGLFDV